MNYVTGSAELEISLKSYLVGITPVLLLIIEDLITEETLLGNYMLTCH
jgi:hypothetical protein